MRQENIFGAIPHPTYPSTYILQLIYLSLHKLAQLMVDSFEPDLLGLTVLGPYIFGGCSESAHER